MGVKFYITEERINIARGLVVGATWIHRLSNIPSMPNGTETVIMSGGITSGRYTFPTTATTMNVVSTSASDDNTKRVTVSGLDENYKPISEIVTLNGTANVTTTNQYLRIQRLSVSGSNSIVGNVTIRNANVLGCLRDGDGQSLQAVYTIPAGQTGYLTQISASVSKGGDAIFKLYSKSATTPPLARHVFSLFDLSYQYDFPYPTVLPEKTDIEMTALSSTGSASATATFDILLVNNQPG